MAAVKDLHGLKWVGDLWGSAPQWTVHLDRKAIRKTVHSAISFPKFCTIKFLAQGAFNKVYMIRADGKEVVVRVTLPVDPGWKTLSEVATLEWVGKLTHLPVPKVLAYGADRDNPIGFEYIIMERMHGKPLADVWHDIRFYAKETLVHQLALFCATTFEQQMNRIGNLFPNPGGNKRHFKIGRIVSADFIWDDCLHQDGLRGPFRSSKDWLSARLTLAENNCRKRLGCVKELKNPDEDKKDTVEGHGKEEEGEVEDYALVNLQAEDWQEGRGSQDRPSSVGSVLSDSSIVLSIASSIASLTSSESRDEDRPSSAGSVSSDSSIASSIASSTSSESRDEDLEELENTMFIISRLRSRLDEFFPTNDQGSEPTMIFHNDLSSHNILVDEGVLTGVVDWECVSFLPLWIACQLPSVLQGKRLDLKPIKSTYQHDENGEVVELYWKHLENYELTQMRSIFLEEMRMLQPRWVEIFESSQRQRDFDLAVTNCGDSFLIRRICNWLKDMDSGVENYQGLEERIDNASL
jgi:aminoglycoside phosphotransferase (APT) family kinase protein